jgi:hypothetical protein
MDGPYYNNRCYSSRVSQLYATLNLAEKSEVIRNIFPCISTVDLVCMIERYAGTIIGESVEER